ncbi:hypothetical protein F4782DRAFT_476592 [Xylaria castorea]|nr:hypothetical protein F4782DRAFT_476592 [Xylaria castorea]
MYLSHSLAMQSGSVSRNQAHSQPILPSHKSRYFHNGIADYRASQNRSRLLHLPPRSSLSPVTLASSGRLTPLQARPQPQLHPFFAQGAAAMGYLPQNALGYSRYPGLQEPIVPLRTQFYDVSNANDSNRPTTNSQAQLKTSNTKSSSFKVASNAAQLASQYTTDKTTPLHKTAQGEKGRNKRSNDACASNPETSARPIKVRLVNRYTDHSKDSSQEVYKTSTSTFAQADKHASQKCQPSQILPRTLEGDNTSGSLDPVTGAVGVSLTRAEPSRARELSQSRPIEANQNVETKTTSATPVSIPERLHDTLVDSPCYNRQDRSSTSQILPQLLTQSSPIRDEHMKSNAPTSKVVKRSASQATTVSATTTQLSCPSEDEDAAEVKESFNPMSMIDETMILERDLSDIVSTRLQEGKPELLDTLYGEILIKMALKDDGLFQAVSRMLQP